jgi:hypothetical protein
MIDEDARTAFECDALDAIRQLVTTLSRSHPKKSKAIMDCFDQIDWLEENEATFKATFDEAQKQIKEILGPL